MNVEGYQHNILWEFIDQFREDEKVQKLVQFNNHWNNFTFVSICSARLIFAFLRSHIDKFFKII